MVHAPRLFGRSNAIPESVIALISKTITVYTSLEHAQIDMLDPWCGDGESLHRLAEGLMMTQRNPPFQITPRTHGIELDGDAAQEARRKLTRVVNDDIFQIDITRSSMDLLLLDLVRKADSKNADLQRRILMYCIRVLKPGGVLLLPVPLRNIRAMADFLATECSYIKVFDYPDEHRTELGEKFVIATRASGPERSDNLANYLRSHAEEGLLYGLMNDPDRPGYVPGATWAGINTVLIDPVNCGLAIEPSTQSRGPEMRRHSFEVDAALEEASRSGWFSKAEFRKLISPQEETRPRPLMPLRQGHLAMLIAGGLLDNVEIRNLSRHLLIKGRAGKKRIETPDPNNDEILRVAEVVGTTVFALDLDNWEFEEITDRLPELIDQFRSSISEQVVRMYEPIYNPNDDAVQIPPLRRRPVGAQRDAIRATALSMGRQRGTIVVGEMGTGKTFISAAAAEAAGMKRVLVLCPTHMVQKWCREIRQTLPSVTTVIAGSIGDLERARQISEQDPSRPVYCVMSRERAKLGYRLKPAYIDRTRHVGLNARTGARDTVRRANTVLERYRVYRSGHKRIRAQVQPCCPRCGEPVRNTKGRAVDPVLFARRRMHCTNCAERLFTPDLDGPKRVALARYVKARMRGWFDLLIVDEVHEYKASRSAQGIAAGMLSEMCGKTLALTGTLMGGMSSTLFWLLWRFDREIRRHFAYGTTNKWIAEYGFKEWRQVRPDLPRAIMDRHSVKTTNMKERPGVNPKVLFHLLHNALFLRLQDVTTDLPPYHEEVEEVAMTEEQEDGYRVLHERVRLAITDVLDEGIPLYPFANYLQSLLTYPDACTIGEEIYLPGVRADRRRLIAAGVQIDDGNLELQPFLTIPPIDASVIYPKEEALLELVREEKLQGRQVLCYITHTGVRDLTPRIQGLLESEGFKVAVLRSGTVAAQDREAWVDWQAQTNGIDVLICHPRLVQTGLDLLAFPTIAHYETEYSVYTVRQASRRSWRIGQTEPVRVVFFAYRATMQSRALQLIADKMHSSLSIEGDMPENGLATMGELAGDVFSELAKFLVEGHDKVDGSLEAVFAAKRESDRNSERMLVREDWGRSPTWDQETGELLSRPGTVGHHAEPEEITLEVCDTCAQFRTFSDGQCVTCRDENEGLSRRRMRRSFQTATPRPTPTAQLQQNQEVRQLTFL